MDSSPTRVLVAGYRAPLLSALRAMRVPFALWHDREGPVAVPDAPVFLAPFSTSRRAIGKTVERIAPSGPFTHVIAAVERSVYPASLARRLLDTRTSKHAVVRRCHDKLKMKEYLAGRGIPMTQFLHLPGDAPVSRVPRLLGTPVVVKDRTGSGGRGISLLSDLDSLQKNVTRNKILEAFVDSDEASVESFVVDGRVRFANITEYRVKGRVNLVPAPFAEGTRNDVLGLNERVIRELGISWGLTHLEVYLSSSEVLFGEIALRPPGGYIMDLLSHAYGFDAWQAFVSNEIGRAFRLPDHPRRHCAVVLLDPGPGVVLAVRGSERVKRHPSVISCNIKAKPGRRVHPREGVGSDSGRVILGAPTLDELQDAVAFVEQTLVFEMDRDRR